MSPGHGRTRDNLAGPGKQNSPICPPLLSVCRTGVEPTARSVMGRRHTRNSVHDVAEVRLPVSICQPAPGQALDSAEQAS